jgi:hypothetical protein
MISKFNLIIIRLTWLSILPLILNLVYIKVVYNNRHRINKTVTVIELACETIRSNPVIFIVPVLLLVTFIIFTIIWIILFNRLWLIGHLSDSPTLSSKAIQQERILSNVFLY